MKKIYVLEHIVEDYYDVFLDSHTFIGIYSSKKNAVKAKKQCKKMERFKLFPNNFYIFEEEINPTEYFWEEGFDREFSREITEKDIPELKKIIKEGNRIEAITAQEIIDKISRNIEIKNLRK